MANPTRYDYDYDTHYYDEDSDTVRAYSEYGQDYDGDGEPINND